MKSRLDVILGEVRSAHGHACAPENAARLSLAHRPRSHVRVIPTADAERAPFRMICKIESVHEGTGFLVSNRHVLTCAHVLLNATKTRIVAPSRVTVSPGLHGIRIPFDSHEAKQIHLFPGYVVGTEVCATDLALIEIDDLRVANAPDPSPGHWGEGASVADPTGTSVGALPGWRPGKYRVNVSGYPTNGQKQVRSFDDTLRIVGPRLAARQQTFLFMRNETHRGMSGSPVWVKRHRNNGGRIAVAMFLGRDGVGGKGYSVARLLDDGVIDFIHRHM